MNSKNHFKEGNRQQKLEIPYDPYYAKIWGKVTAVSHLSIHSYYFLTHFPPKNTSDRNEAAHEGWDELAGILCSFPRYFEKEIEFWTPLFRVVLGRKIEECVPPHQSKKRPEDPNRHLCRFLSLVSLRPKAAYCCLLQ